MPQQQGSKKKKGRAPSHQNTFAFKHNPKSKKTDKILNSPNVHVCRRCHDKIEWRKKYRKYKPLTQPSKCNLCHQRKVKAAYHTICTDCTTSDKARNAVATHSTNNGTTPTENEARAAGDRNMEQNETCADNTEAEIYRACAVCVKEPALHRQDDNAEEHVDHNFANAATHMRLREKRALDRKLARHEEEAKQEQREARCSARVDNDDQNGPKKNDHLNNVEEYEPHTDDDTGEDPFVKAVGGTDKLLTGEAYQKMLLEKAGENQ